MPSTNVSALVLIYDIRGFTSASKRMRTADLGAFATAAHRTILDLFAAHPPTFVKNLGDGHLLLWETGPEPDPALLAAVVDGATRARTAFTAFVAGQGAAGTALPKHVGVGVAFGEVARHDDYYGVALNLAARLQNLARPEGLALDETVFDVVARRDAAIREGFRRARVRLKGLGRTLVWVRRPFSWSRLLGRVARIAAVVAVPLAYVGLADADVRVPAGDALRLLIDRHDLSLLRPVRSDAEVRARADSLRRRLAAALLDARAPEGWVYASFLNRAQTVSDAWSSSQALCAIVRAPHLANADVRALFPGVLWPFTGLEPVEVKGVAYGWAAHDGFAYTEAEPTLWTAAALAAALGRPAAVPAAERPEWLRRLAWAQRACDLYRPRDDGGWNMFPNQQDPARANPYTTTLALLALLETRAAGLPWGASTANRDALLAATARWLDSRFTEHAGVRGWRGTSDVSDPVSLGVTLQVMAERLRAEAEAGIALPAPVRDEVPHLLSSLVGRSLADAYDAGENTVPFTAHGDRAMTGTESVNFLWHPWAIDAAARWLARPPEPGADPAVRVRVRRALGHLVVDMGPDAFRSATAGYVFIASETLYGLNAIPPPE